MRIGLVTDTYVPQVNGVSTIVRRSVDALERAGHDVAVVAPRYPEGEAAAAGELRVRSLPFPPYPAIRLSLPSFGGVARFLDGFRPDLVHVHTEGPLGLAGRRYALERRLPARPSGPSVWTCTRSGRNPSRNRATPPKLGRERRIAG